MRKRYERLSVRRERQQATSLWAAIAVFIWGFVVLAVAYLGGPTALMVR